MAKFRALQTYIERENQLAHKFGNDKLPVPDQLTTEQATSLFHQLDDEINPVSLFCDGETTIAQARERFNLFIAAVKDLDALGFTKPQDMEYI